MSLASSSELTRLKSDLIRLINQKNTPDASTTVAGKIEIATSLEVQQGVIDYAAITPKTLIEAIKDQDSSIAMEFKKLISDEISSSQQIPKNNLEQLKIDLSTQVKKLINDFIVNDSRIIDEIVLRILSDDKYMSNIAGASAKYKE